LQYKTAGVNTVVGQFGVGKTGAFTEPSAVAPDAGVNLDDDGRQFKGSRKTHFFAREPHKVYPILRRGDILLNTEVDPSIRRYHARFGKAIDLANSKLTH
jgi:hypothetical protein